MKRCPKCNKDIQKVDFGKNKAKVDGLQTHCKVCRKSINNEHYANSARRRENIRRNQKNAYEKSREYIKHIKSISSCFLCGESESCTLDFHHIIGKEFGIAENIGNVSLKRLKEEISKCVILCANCHRKVHAGILILQTGSNPPGAPIPDASFSRYEELIAEIESTK